MINWHLRGTVKPRLKSPALPTNVRLCRPNATKLQDAFCCWTGGVYHGDLVRLCAAVHMFTWDFLWRINTKCAIYLLFFGVFACSSLGFPILIYVFVCKCVCLVCVLQQRAPDRGEKEWSSRFLSSPVLSKLPYHHTEKVHFMEEGMGQSCRVEAGCQTTKDGGMILIKKKAEWMARMHSAWVVWYVTHPPLRQDNNGKRMDSSVEDGSLLRPYSSA